MAILDLSEIEWTTERQEAARKEAQGIAIRAQLQLRMAMKELQKIPKEERSIGDESALWFLNSAIEEIAQVRKRLR